MSHRAWAYIWGVLVTGALLSLLALMEFQPLAQSELLTFVVLVAMGTIAQLFEAEHGKQSYYPHFVFFFAGVILLPQFLFVFLVTIPHVIEWAKSRLTKSQHLRSWYIQPFNIATHIMAGSVAHVAYSYVESTADPMLTLTPVLAATAAVVSY